MILAAPHVMESIAETGKSNDEQRTTESQASNIAPNYGDPTRDHHGAVPNDGQSGNRNGDAAR